MIPAKIKEDFCAKYNYLRPDAEKNGWETLWDNTAEWCKEHWQEIVTTVGIIVGAALAVYDTLNLPKKASEFPEKSKGNSLNKAGHIESPLHYIYPLSKHHQR